MQPKPPDEADRVASINESAKHVGALTLTVLAVCVYLGVAVASTTHEVLFLGRSFPLPLFSAEVSLELFYVIAPLFLVVLHVHLLLQDYILVTKLVDPPWAKDGLATYYFPEVTVSRMLGWEYQWPAPVLLKTIRWMVYLVLPVGLLLFTQGKFLAYHSFGTTLWHQFLVTSDFLLILTFRWRIAGKRREMKLREAEHKGVYYFFWFVLWLAFSAVCLFSWGIASIPVPGKPGKLDKYWVFEWPAKNLSLRERVLLSRDQEGLTLDEAHHKQSKGISLNRRDLAGADFTGARLINADFRGADLRSANFSGADLRGARFMPAGAADGMFERPPGSAKRLQVANARGDLKGFPPTRLEKANFTDARLEGASLILVSAADATLIRTDLRGVELTYADLRGAHLRKARLAGADLWHALLHGADLTNADLRAADLSFAELEGAVLEHAYLAASDLSNARLAGAWFAGADLRAVQFRDAQSTGASFRGAVLQGSRGLILRGVSLRQAKLDAFCPGPDLPPQLVDFREAEFPGPEYERRVWSGSILDEVPRGPRRDAALHRLKSQPIQPYCRADAPHLSPASLMHLGLLYHDERRPGLLKDWPLVAEQAIQAGAGWTEGDFYAELAAFWVEDACRSESTALAMTRLVTRPFGRPPILAEEELLTALKDRLKQRLEQARERRPGIGLPCPALLGLKDEDLKKLAPEKH